MTNIYFSLSEDWKHKIRFCGESYSGLQGANFLYPHMVEEVRESSNLFYESTNPIHEGSALMT